ncbi:hypothetical protein [Primorskyibacter sp. S187A]|uniref:hypothetical protein n=1 Tax=Primorskyibacter sp. S187A TaxID=3415130 RepID=UPI003C79E5D2
MRLAVIFAAMVLATQGSADFAETTKAVASKTGDTWRIDVTLLHPDTGWDHYADGWEVLDADGNRLGYRKLHHPHVNEQPFTRSLTGISIPAGTTRVFVRGHCNVHGWHDETVPVDLR